MPYPKVYGSYTVPPPQSSSPLGVIRITPSVDCITKMTKFIQEVHKGDDKKVKKAKKISLKSATSLACDEIKLYTLSYDIVDVEVVLGDTIASLEGGVIVQCFLDAGAERVCLGRRGVEVAGVPKGRVTGMEEGMGCRYQDFRDLDKVEGDGWFHSYKNPKGTRKIVTVKGDIGVGGIVELLKSGWSVCVEDGDVNVMAEATARAVKTDREDGLLTTVVVDRCGIALGLVYSNIESVSKAIVEGRGIYWSRSRGGLWRKGDTSGCYQTLYRVDCDCDGDAVRFTVKQHGEPPAFCHEETEGCWGDMGGLGGLERTVRDRLVNSVEGSYTKRLFEDETLLRNKVSRRSDKCEAGTSLRTSCY